MKKLAALSLLFVLAVPVLADHVRETREREPHPKSIVRIIRHIVRAIGVTADFPTTPKP